MSEDEFPESFNDVAIVGMAGRFPAAANLETFWENLAQGVEGISTFSDEEVLAAGVPRHLVDDPAYVKAGGILDDIDRFDAGYFGLNPREAEVLDPQHRIFLECAVDTLRAAACDPSRFAGLIGVFAGCSLPSYLLQHLLSRPDVLDSLGRYQVMMSNDKDFLATRVSYKLNLKGPSLDVQTACSTSLVAVHLAAQSLLGYQCDLALAGGVSLMLPQKSGYLYRRGMIFSPDGHCRAFDAAADGIVPGEGVGIVALKRLADAIDDRDTIHAVIKGSAINNDGSAKIGYTAPSREGQAEVIAQAQATAGISPETISYIEAHGTGTPLGDPIEMAALTDVFRAATDRSGFCAIGSIKSNIGHLDIASGVAGLIKTTLALERQVVPPSLHFNEPNPEIDFASTPFYVVSEAQPWVSGKTPRRAGVSSFGIGGTNAHLVLEEAPPRSAGSHSRPWQLLLLSARSSNALDEETKALAAHLERRTDHDLADVAHTLQVGREVHAHRRAVVCRDRQDAVGSLETLKPARVHDAIHLRGEPAVGFLFPGQGSQHVRMAHEIYASEEVFRTELDACCDLLTPLLGIDLRQMIFCDGEQVEEAAAQLTETRLTQPALFSIEYSLARQWMEWGVSPKAMIGHSIGEYVAACLAGVFSRNDALRLVATRGRLMQEQAAGSMLAVFLAEDELRARMPSTLALAAINTPALCVVSGDGESIDAFRRQLADSRVESRPVRTSHAFHSPMMEPMLEAFRGEVAAVERQPPQIPFVSNVSGDWIRPEEATDPDYWARQVRGTVRFADGLGRMLETPGWALLEVGPGRTLGSFATQHPARSDDDRIVSSLPHPLAETSDLASLLAAVGDLWMAGVEIDWTSFYRAETRNRVPLGGHPFERQTYWVEPGHGAATPGPGAEASTAVRRELTDWFYEPSWQRGSAPVLTAGSQMAPGGVWWVFSTGSGLSETISARLEELDQRVVRIATGAAYRRRNDRLFELRPGEASDFKELVTELRSDDLLPSKIVHAWGVDDLDTVGATDPRAATNLHFYSLLYLLQQLGATGDLSTVHLQVVTTGLHVVSGGEPIEPAKALTLGPSQIAPQEHKGLTACSVDVTAPSSAAERARLADTLIAEALAPDDPVIAYRGGFRWTRCFAPLALGPAAEDRHTLRNGGTYLITGGLGGVGFVLARFLAQEYGARLALLQRSTVPPRETWETWLAEHDSEERTSRRILRLRRLEEAGAEVRVVTADVTDRDLMRSAVADVKAAFGEIHGVVHAAGVAGGGILQLKEPSTAAAVLAPKVTGTEVLASVVPPGGLDFMMLCSSRSSVLPDLGQVDYCAANAFLDAFAQYWSAETGGRVLAVNWDTWREVGMAVETELPANLQALREHDLQCAISSPEGSRAFERLLDSAAGPQILVSTLDLNAELRKRLRHPAVERLEEAARPRRQETDSVADLHARPDVATDYLAPQSTAEQVLAEIWRSLLGIDRIGADDFFFDLGGNSLLSIEVVAKVEARLGALLQPVDIFNQTLGQLAASCERQTRDDVDDGETDRPQGAERPASSPSRDLPAGGTASDSPSPATTATSVATSEPSPVPPRAATGVVAPPLIGDSLAVRGNKGLVFEPAYFGPDGSLFGCFHLPPAGTSTHQGIVLCNAAGHEYTRSHRAYRYLAERLAIKGYDVLRFDFFATGDSAGADSEAGIARWVEDIASAVGELETRTGAERISLVGRRLGATLAVLHAAAHPGIERLVLWDPTLRGHAYLDDLRRMHSDYVLEARGHYVGSLLEPEELARQVGDRAEYLGQPMTARQQEEITALDIHALADSPTAASLLIDSGPQPVLAPFVSQLTSLGVTVDHRHLPDPESWSVDDPLRQIVPNRILESIVAWFDGDEA